MSVRTGKKGICRMTIMEVNLGCHLIEDDPERTGKFRMANLCTIYDNKNRTIKDGITKD